MEKKSAWLSELPNIVWAYRTTKRRSANGTPFAMVYGVEAVIPTEIGFLTLRSEVSRSKEIKELLKENLDLAEERK